MIRRAPVPPAPLLPRRAMPLAALLALMPRRHAAAETWHLYQHPRLGTRIAYPDRFTRDPSHDDPDGARFTSSDDAFFLVYGMPNRAGHDLAGLLNFALGSMGPGRRITYRAQGRSWFVLSGFQDDQILYERHLLSPDRSIAHAFVMVYPAALRRPYDPIVTRMSRSFGAA